VTGLETTAPWWRPDATRTSAAAAAPPVETGRTAFAGLLAFTAILIVSPQAWIPVLERNTELIIAAFSICL
jgi:hypothetical protein